MAGISYLNGKDGWLSLNKQGLARLNSRKPAVLYLKRLTEGLILESTDTYCIRINKGQILFHCSYLSHCRIIERMSELFLYKGISFNECQIVFEKGDVRTKMFSAVSNVVVMTISVSELYKNKCELTVKNKFSEEYEQKNYKDNG